MPDVISISAHRHTAVMQVAEQVLGDEDQVEISVLLDDGKLSIAQAKLLGAVDRLMMCNQLSADEVRELQKSIGLSEAEADCLRTASADLW